MTAFTLKKNTRDLTERIAVTEAQKIYQLARSSSAPGASTHCSACTRAPNDHALCTFLYARTDAWSEEQHTCSDQTQAQPMHSTSQNQEAVMIAQPLLSEVCSCLLATYRARLEVSVR